MRLRNVSGKSMNLNIDKNTMSQVQSFPVSAHRNIIFNKVCKREMPARTQREMIGKEQDVKGNEMKGKERK